MRLLNKYTTIIPTLIVMASIANANQDNKNPEDYQIVALEDCEVVSRTTMTQEQLDAYLPLRDAEKLIEELEIPMEEMEEQLDEYTEQIEAITELAIQEVGDSIHIDKRYLSKQKELAEKIEAIVSLHQEDIDAIQIQGEDIGKKARAFEKTIDASLKGIEYDQVRIVTPDEDRESYVCGKRYF